STGWGSGRAPGGARSRSALGSASRSASCSTPAARRRRRSAAGNARRAAQSSRSAATRAAWARRSGPHSAQSGSWPAAARAMMRSVESASDIRLEHGAVPDVRADDVVPPLELHAAPDPAVDDAATGSDDGFGADRRPALENDAGVDDGVRPDPDVDIHEHALREEERDALLHVRPDDPVPDDPRGAGERDPVP